MIRVKRYFLEILKENVQRIIVKLPNEVSIKVEDKNNYEINKFFL